MNADRWWMAALCSIVLVVGLTGNPTSAQIPGGRFQMFVVGKPGDSVVYCLDVHTGHCWSKQPGHTAKWTDHGSPTAPAK